MTNRFSFAISIIFTVSSFGTFVGGCASDNSNTKIFNNKLVRLPVLWMIRRGMSKLSQYMSALNIRMTNKVNSSLLLTKSFIKKTVQDIDLTMGLKS